MRRSLNSRVGASRPRSRAAAENRRYSRGGNLLNLRQLLTALWPTPAILAAAALPPSASINSLAVTSPAYSTHLNRVKRVEPLPEGSPLRLQFD